MDIDLRLLRYFVVVAEELHFTRAAERLHMSQPALSNQIKRLEQRLGLVLFARNTRDVRLTNAGESLLPRARDAIASVSLGIAEARAGSHPTLRLDILDSALDTPRRILHHLRSLSPHLSVETTTLGTSNQHQKILAGELDAALGSDRGIPDGIAHEIVRRESVAVVMPESHPLAGLAEVSPSALSGDTHYLPRDDFAPDWNQFVRQICRDSGFEPRRHVVKHGWHRDST